MNTYSTQSGRRRSRRLPEVLSSEEQSALLSAAFKDTPVGRRNLAMLTLFLNLGLRVSEMLNLRETDITWNTGKVMVRQGKGNRDRALWLKDEDLELVRRWLKVRPVESEYIFCTLKGKRLSDRYVRKLVKRCGREKIPGKDVHPHLLRHTFATDLLENSGNIRMVQKALGHSSLLTTMIYTHIVDSALESTLKTFRSADPPGAGEGPEKTC